MADGAGEGVGGAVQADDQARDDPLVAYARRVFGADVVETRPASWEGNDPH